MLPLTPSAAVPSLQWICVYCLFGRPVGAYPRGRRAMGRRIRWTGTAVSPRSAK